MKKDSNMFNDNSIETEGIPADKTAEIPKVVGSTEEENAKKPLVLFGREFSRKQVCVAGAGILCAALLIGGGAYAISHASWTGDSNAPAVSQSKDDEKQDMVLTLEVKADGWDADTSTPVIAHIEDADGKVDFYTAIAANKQVTVKVGKSGTYTVTLIPPVNADGSTYKAASSKVKAGKDDKKTNGTVITLEKVDADKVTKDDLTAIAKDIAEAVKKGDSTLTGDKGAEVVNNVTARGQEIASEAAARGADVAATIQEAASNISPTINEKGDELRDKIEAARQRIADQVAKNADADADAAETVKDVAETAKEAAKDAAVTAEEGAKETAAEVKEAAGEVAKAAEGKKDEK